MGEKGEAMRKQTTFVHSVVEFLGCFLSSGGRTMRGNREKEEQRGSVTDMFLDTIQ